MVSRFSSTDTVKCTLKGAFAGMQQYYQIIGSVRRHLRAALFFFEILFGWSWKVTLELSLPRRLQKIKNYKNPLRIHHFVANSILPLGPQKFFHKGELKILCILKCKGFWVHPYEKTFGDREAILNWLQNDEFLMDFDNFLFFEASGSRRVQV